MPLKLYKRGEIWHYRGTIAGRRIRGTTETSEKARAQRIAAEREQREWTRHLDGPGATLSFADAAIAYRQAGKTTRFLDRVEDYWRDTLVKDITSQTVRAAAIKLYPNAGAATRNRQAVVPTQAIVNFAAENDWCPHLKVHRFKVKTKIKEPVTAEWVDKFVEHASPHLGALCMFMYGTGARIGEAVALTWANVDLQARIAIIRQSKIGGDEREAHLPTRLLAAISNIPSNRNPEERVFRYTHANAVRQVWNNAIARAGIKRLSPHSCRHGFATTMLHKGIDVKTVAERGGWKDVATLVKTYAHAMADRTVTDVLFDTNPAQSDSRKASSN
jgi:integrase